MCVNKFIAEYKPLYIFPRTPIESFEFVSNERELFDHIPEDGKCIRVKTIKKWIGFSNSETSELPKIPFYYTDLEPEKFKERDFYLYANEKKYVTVCIFRKEGQLYYFHSRTDKKDKLFFDDLYLRLSVEANDTGREIGFEYGIAGGNFEEVKGDISFEVDEKKQISTDEYFRFKIKIIMRGEGDIDNKQPIEEKFQVVAKTLRKKGNEEVQLDEKRLTMIYSTYQGWTLTENGHLKQGRTGWLVDEKGLYILKDGRRLNKEDKNLGIRVEDVKLGLEDILEGVLHDDIHLTTKPKNSIYLKADNDLKYKIEKPIKNEYKVYDELLKEHYNSIKKLVVIQAFQINACYQNKNSFMIGENAKFYSIGEDETKIPIIVTQIGNDNAQKKLVIAGPHGDERNAQRLIMASQKHFVQNEKPDDTVFYFIPCLSPTMAFADARGIPVVNENGERVPSINQLLLEYKSNKKNIQYLHGLLTKRITAYNSETGEDNSVLMRDAIQNNKYNGIPFHSNGEWNSDFPRYGIDANRDINIILPSSVAFYNFVKTLRSSHVNNISVFMIHGYTQFGDVYGPYFRNESGEVRMTNEVKKYVNYILTTIFREKKYNHNDKIILNKKDKDPEREFYYTIWNENGKHDTIDTPDKLAGEWGYLLYGKNGEKGILSFDIELPSNYNEGVRSPEYNDRKVGDEKLLFFKEDNGIVVKERRGFYYLLKKYYHERDI